MSGFDYDETMKLVEKVIALQKEIEELKSLIKEATPWVICVKDTLPEYRQAIATKVLIEWLGKAEKIK